MFVARVCRNIIHIYIKEGLRFKSRDENHPVSDRIGHALRHLGCRTIVHRELLDHEMNQFGGGMKSPKRRHYPNKVLKQCGFPVNQGIFGCNVHDRYGNLVLVNGIIFMPLADAVCAGFERGFPLRDLNTLRLGYNILTIRSKENK